jgi:hypothetical protein
MAITLSGPAIAQTSVEPLLQSQIAVSWNAPVQGLGQVLAERLALPYFDGSGSVMATVVLDQGETATVAQALESINAQIAPAHLGLHLSQGAHGQRLELTKTQPDSTVVGVTAGVATGSVQATVVPSPAHTLSLLPQAQAVTPPAALQQWEVSPADATLRNSLRKWTEKAGWQLLWEASSDVPIPVKATFEGDFRAAVLALFDTLSASEVALNGLMYRGNKVLRVVEAGYRAE